MWLYEALEQNVGLDGWMDGVGDTPQTVMTTRAPSVLITIMGRLGVSSTVEP